MTTDLPEKNQEAVDDNGRDWDDRVLCSDGNCIGVIGADGRCKECGKKFEAKLGEPTISEQNDQPDTEDEDLPSTATDTDHIEDVPVDDEWDNRVLCGDGNCIGVIGPDGKCKECGKPLE